MDGWVTRRYAVQSRLAYREQTGRPGRRRCPLVSGRRADAGEPFWRLARVARGSIFRTILIRPVRQAEVVVEWGRGGEGIMQWPDWQSRFGRPASATVPLWFPSPSWHCLTHTFPSYTVHVWSSSFARHCPPCSPSVLCTGRVPHPTAYCPAHPRASPSGNGMAALDP